MNVLLHGVEQSSSIYALVQQAVQEFIHKALVVYTREKPSNPPYASHKKQRIIESLRD